MPDRSTDRSHIEHITASFGVATTADHGVERTILLGAADSALYLAKQRGRNRVVVADPPVF